MGERQKKAKFGQRSFWKNLDEDVGNEVLLLSNGVPRSSFTENWEPWKCLRAKIILYQTYSNHVHKNKSSIEFNKKNILIPNLGFSLK